MTIDTCRVVVAIPVRNEADHIVPCLLALARQQPLPSRVVLLLNNCCDATAERARAVDHSLPFRCQISEIELHGEQSNAGFARGLAMRLASAGLSDDDVLITTDADGEVTANWLAATLAAISRGADAVCGRAEIGAADARAIPPALHADDARERRLASLLEEIATIIDPDDHDPWPRHAEHSGASIAVTVAAWRRAGGIPAVACGEDRAFIDRLRRMDARIRHEPAARVIVSGRIQGRAEGGMADTIRRRIQCQDEYADETIEPAADFYRRVGLRVRLRAAWSGRGAAPAGAGVEDLAATLDMQPARLRHALASAHFGAAWASLEAECAVLRRRRVRFVDLADEISAATTLRRLVRGGRSWQPPATIPPTWRQSAGAPRAISA